MHSLSRGNVVSYCTVINQMLLSFCSLDGQSSSNTSVVHSSQASTVHSHSSSGLGCGGVGSSTPGTPRRDEELGEILLSFLIEVMCCAPSQATVLLYVFSPFVSLLLHVVDVCHCNTCESWMAPEEPSVVHC